MSAARLRAGPEVARAVRGPARLRTLACVGLAIALLAAAGEAPLEFETLAGERVRVALDQGEAGLVVHFWASWCVDCEAELPALDAPRSAARGRSRWSP